MPGALGGDAVSDERGSPVRTSQQKSVVARERSRDLILLEVGSKEQMAPGCLGTLRRRPRPWTRRVRVRAGGKR